MTPREWMLRNRATCATLRKVDIATRFGVTRQRIDQICQEEGIETASAYDEKYKVARAEKIARQYRKAFQKCLPRTWREVAFVLSIDNTTEHVWRRTLSDEQREQYAKKLVRNRRAQDGLYYWEKVADLLNRRPHHYTVRMLGDTLGISEMHARMALYAAIERIPALANKYVARYAKGER